MVSRRRLRCAGVKQQLAPNRMLFNWLVTSQVAPANPGEFGPGPQNREGKS
jgi:hypothetical protein